MPDNGFRPFRPGAPRPLKDNPAELGRRLRTIAARSASTAGEPAPTALPVHQHAPPDGNPNPRGRLPVVVLCSPRPRVGRTLVARLLVEYFHVDSRKALAFDLNPDDPVLSDWLPFHAIRATIDDMWGQMTLFDRLIVNDSRPKVVDVAPDHFEAFLDVMEKIEFAEHARAMSIDTVILFLAENHPRSTSSYRRLLQRFGRVAVVPVHNALIEHFHAAEFLQPSAGMAPIHIGCLSPFLRGVVSRPQFSFAEYLTKPADHPTLLHEWINRSFVAFRDLELRLMMAEFAPLFQHSA